MARNSPRQWSSTAASNTDIAGISLAEGVTKPSDVNDFERAHMAQIAQYLAEMSFPTVGGTSDALTLTPTTALAALASNVVYTGTILSANTTQTPTLNVSGLGAKVIRKISGNTDVALSVGDLPTGGLATFVYSTTANSSGGAWLIPNPVVQVFPVGPLTNLASASTTDLGTIGSHNINITGTTTITAFGSTAATGQPLYELTFAAALTLTYNATSLILPGAANIVTAAGDVARAVYLGSGNWQIIDYVRKTVAPVLSAGIAGGFRNLVLTVTGNTTGTITADGAVLFDTNGNAYYASAVNLTNTNSGAGANGLDTGSLATSTWYAVFIIYNPTTNTVACLISLSATAPTLPSGYTFKLRVGWWYNAASGGYRRTIQYGRRAQYVVGTNPSVPIVMTSGNATTWTAVAVAAFVPTTASVINVGLGVSANAVADVAPNNSYAAATNTGFMHTDTSTDSQALIPISMMLESTNIYYGGSGGGGTLLAFGWEDNLN